jgi:hypothetical protein
LDTRGANGVVNRPTGEILRSFLMEADFHPDFHHILGH